eukprot:TRINITY_DN15595_c0_g1_i1.p1 TRINITY_DN15595_c0_g1~~TRINITY_DN15595_c0_g1_i1.p1  ORF type:complete len:262 (+),score=40.19 TRINITY_DN15595_c0_g1_i1:178-963(+)
MCIRDRVHGGGHGIGAKVALAAGCYHIDRVTGVVCIDSAPLDHRYFEPFIEFKEYISKLREIQLENSDKNQIMLKLKKEIACPQWRKIFLQNLVQEQTSIKSTEQTILKWNFALEYLHQNLQKNKADSIGCWTTKMGLYTGRGLFIFPEYSRWVHLNTNTLAIHKICPQVKGFGHDIFYIQGDDNPLNHWIYEFPESSWVVHKKILKFLTMYDGVHVLLKDRSEIGKFFIPDIKQGRKNKQQGFTDYSPSHIHHNWRFNGQ